jgi:dihydrofolate synthase/folylpolyglutamate synthase
MYNLLLKKIFSSYPMYHRIGSAAYKEGLENIEQLALIAGNPQNSFKSIHVAGTNGKGSVAHFLASYFQECGFKTGLFTSPHLVDFNERIKINGIKIPEECVIDFFDHYKSKIDLIEPSFFEMTTILAFDYFAREKVDIAVIETGLGGRLDSTNIILPEISVITNISLEHTQMLGDTLPKIAAEKAGIIKKNRPVVIGEYDDSTFPVFKSKAEEMNASLYLAEKNISVISREVKPEVGKRVISIYYKDQLIAENVILPLIGNYQLKNIATFVQTVKLLKEDIPFQENVLKKSIEKVLENTNFIGRWQIVDFEPLTICDVAHNVAGIKEIVSQLQNMNYRRLHFVIGFVNDKDVDSILTLLPKENTTYYICRADIERALECEVLENKMKLLNFTTVIGETVPHAYLKAKEAATSEDLIFIGGSCFVVGDFLKNLNLK